MVRVSGSLNGDEVIVIVIDCVLDCLMEGHAFVVVNKIVLVSASAMVTEIEIVTARPIVKAMACIESVLNGD